MHLTMVARRRCTLAGRTLEVGDVVELDTYDNLEMIVVRLPFNPGAALGLLADDALDPIDISPDDARDLLRGMTRRESAPIPPPATPGVLPFAPPRRRRRA